MVSEPIIFLCIPAPAYDAPVVNPNGIIMLLANGLSILFINGNLTFINGARSQTRIPSDCFVLES